MINWNLKCCTFHQYRYNDGLLLEWISEMYKGVHRIKKECGLDSLNIGGGFPSKFL
jgi:hypothetical protein